MTFRSINLKSYLKSAMLSHALHLISIAETDRLELHNFSWIFKKNEQNRSD